MHTTNLGLDFTDENGVRIRCYQLLNDQGYAVAIADFYGRKLIRFASTDDAKLIAADWLANIQTQL